MRKEKKHTKLKHLLRVSNDKSRLYVCVIEEEQMKMEQKR